MVGTASERPNALECRSVAYEDKERGSGRIGCHKLFSTNVTTCFFFCVVYRKGSIYLSLNRSRFFFMALLALYLVLFLPAAFAQNKVFESLDDLNKANFWGNQPYIPHWLKDGNRYLEWRDNEGQSELMAVDAKTGTIAPFYDPKKMADGADGGGNGSRRGGGDVATK